LKKVLISGGTGFIGSWVASHLSNFRYQVAVLSREHSDLWRLKDLPVTFFSDPKLALSDFKPTSVISLDWDGVENSDRNSKKQQFSNIERVVNFAKLCNSYDVQHFIGVGSQAEYGPKNSVISEDMECSPTTEYGRAKLETFLELEKLFEQKDTVFSWVRVFSTFGALDTGNWLIKNLLESFASNADIPLTLGEQRWSYLHVYDAARAFESIISSKTQGPFNLGHPQAPTLRQTVEDIKALTKSNSKLLFGEIPYRDDQVMTLAPNTSKLESLGWVPSVEFNKGVLHTSSWLKDEMVEDLANPSRVLPLRT
jgi:UDP-glucose 4-epimerase